MAPLPPLAAGLATDTEGDEEAAAEPDPAGVLAAALARSKVFSSEPQAVRAGSSSAPQSSTGAIRRGVVMVTAQQPRGSAEPTP
ncbi:hypothetical protein [Luteococcus japonicus]|uniref:hypothetical protein n=1 Tax=Luteococcus japonicus TaxID=33984 RepID=UPI000B9AFAFB|nr:hypothetical protein [Luteococcus japonicus]